MSCPARDLGWWRVTGRVAQCSCCHELSRRMWFTVCTEQNTALCLAPLWWVDITVRPKVRLKVAGWGISANFVSSVQYILSAELKTRKFWLRMLSLGNEKGSGDNAVRKFQFLCMYLLVSSLIINLHTFGQNRHWAYAPHWRLNILFTSCLT